MKIRSKGALVIKKVLIKQCLRLKKQASKKKNVSKNFDAKKSKTTKILQNK